LAKLERSRSCFGKKSGDGSAKGLKKLPVDRAAIRFLLWGLPILPGSDLLFSLSQARQRGYLLFVS